MNKLNMFLLIVEGIGRFSDYSITLINNDSIVTFRYQDVMILRIVLEQKTFSYTMYDISHIELFNYIDKALHSLGYIER